METNNLDDILTEEYRPEPDEPITPEEEAYWKEHAPASEAFSESYGDEDQNDAMNAIKEHMD